MTIWLEVKVAGGSPIEEVTREACDLAARVGVAVHFTFNEVACWAEPYGVRPEEFAERWKRAMEGGGKYPACTNRVMPADPTGEKHGG